MKKALIIFFAFLSFRASAQFIVEATSMSVSCPGRNDGQADVQVLSGFPPYIYRWSDPAEQSTRTAIGLSAGQYSVLIIDSLMNDTLIPITVEEPDSIIFRAVVINSKCEAAIGKITLRPSGGTGPYSYYWHNSGTTTSQPVMRDLVGGSYTVTITDDKGCTADSVITVPEDQCEVKGDKVFTPNSDGINDTWHINNINFFPNAKISVYNRWGQIVHEQTGEYAAWDGTHLGMKLPDATYYYVIYRNAIDKEKGIETGSVTIVR